VALARELDLPVRFAVGEGGVDLQTLVARSHALVTTSIAEGFGLAFLEPWLLERALVGRDLAEITADFVEAGVRLPGLYARLDVPLQWLDPDRLRRAFAGAAARRAAAYGRAAAGDAERAWQSAVRETHIDFGRLDEAAQASVIRRLRADAGARAALRPRTLAATAGADLIAANRAIIGEAYSLQGFGERLVAIYTAAMTAAPSAAFAAARGDALLDAFLAPERLSLLRS
jgi:hypothetical protein